VSLLRRASELGPTDLATIQNVLATDPAIWELLEGAPLRPDEAQHLVTVLPPGVPLERKWMWISDGIVMEMVEGFPDAETWYLGLIFVAPRVRGMGIGTQLLRWLEHQIGKRGGTKLRLAVVVENTGARSLYRRLGYHFVARRQRGTQLVDVLERALT
jgi:ribosomal protein S18 acetylase RimI-like enzyme